MKTALSSPSSSSPNQKSLLRSQLSVHDTKEAVHTQKIVVWTQYAWTISAFAWLVIISAIFYLSGPMSDDNPSYARVSARSSTIANYCGSFQLVAIALRTIHHINTSKDRWMIRFGSSPFHMTIIVMLISALTNFLLANYPTPVLHDQISGMTVYALRWAEWIVLGGTLTFQVEVLDAKFWKVPTLMALSQTLSCSCGLLFPLISDRPYLWIGVMFISVVTWLCIFPRLFYTWKLSKKILTTPEKKDSFAGRLILTAVNLRLMLVIIWSIIVCNYFIYLIINRSGIFNEIDGQENSSVVCQLYTKTCPRIFSMIASVKIREEFSFVWDCVWDSISKLLFTTLIIEQFEYCLDHCRLLENQFDDIRAELNIIWNHSSDVLIVATEKNNTSSSLDLFHSSSDDNETDEDEQQQDPLSKVMRGARKLAQRRQKLRFLVSAQASRGLHKLIGQHHLGYLPEKNSKNNNDTKTFLDANVTNVAGNFVCTEDDEDMNMSMKEREREENSTDPSGLLTMLRKAWDDHRTDGSWNSIFEFKIKHPIDGFKDIELVVNKVNKVDGTTLMVAVARDISSRSKAFQLEFEKEKNLVARETAHTVKNLNTTAHHKLLDLLEELHEMPDSSSDQTENEIEMEEKEEKEKKETERSTTLKNLKKLYRRREHFVEQIRQTLAIMMTAAQQTYQLSRVGEILRGEKQHLDTSVCDCTKTWQKICVANFFAEPDALALLVDEFRLVALLSNAWNNALSHGDCTRMNETQIILQARSPNMLVVQVVNASQPDELPFDKYHTDIDGRESAVSFEQHKKDGFGKSPAAKLTTQMGISWMKKLCAGRLTLKSEGHGGKTTLECIIDADFSELFKVAVADFVIQRKKSNSPSNGNNQAMERRVVKAKEASPSTVELESESFQNIAKQKIGTNTSRDTVNDDDTTNNNNKKNKTYTNKRQTTPVINTRAPSPTITRSKRSPSFTSSPRSSLSSLPPYANALLSKTTTGSSRGWDAALACALLEKFGITIVDDSRAFALCVRKGFGKAFGITKCNTICGSQSTRYKEVCSLLQNNANYKDQPALIVLDRNLGHGINTEGQRVTMPNGDIISTRLRQKGMNCCLILLTGDSSEQLKQYSELYQGYFIDLVLDKHHLPSYVHIFEQYTKWISEKLSLGKILTNESIFRDIGSVSCLCTILEEINSELVLVQDVVKKYRRCGNSGNNGENSTSEVVKQLPVQKCDDVKDEGKEQEQEDGIVRRLLGAWNSTSTTERKCDDEDDVKDDEKDDEKDDKKDDEKDDEKDEAIIQPLMSDALDHVYSLHESLNKRDEEENKDEKDERKEQEKEKMRGKKSEVVLLQTSLRRVQPLLKLCKVKELSNMIDAILKDPSKALIEAADEAKLNNQEEMEEESLRKPGLLLHLAREVSLITTIIKMAIHVLKQSTTSSSNELRRVTEIAG